MATTKKKNKKNRVQFLKEKYVKLIESSPFFQEEQNQSFNGIIIKTAEDLFDIFKKYDPTYHKKYLLWMLERFLDDRKVYNSDAGEYENVQRLKVEDLVKFNKDLDFFDKHKDRFPVNKRNINQYKDIQDFFEVVDEVKPKDEVSISLSQLDKQYKQEIDIWLDNENWKVVIPHTLNAASVYGKGTKWCTTMENGGSIDHYLQKGPLIILINKKADKDDDSNHKYQFHFETNQFMNAKDGSIPSLNDFLSNNQDVLYALVDNIKKEHATKLKIQHGIPLKEEDKIIKPSKDTNGEEKSITLNLTNINVENLEEGLYVDGNVNLEGNDNIKKIKDITVTGNLIARESTLESLEGNIKVDGTCDLNKCKKLKYVSDNIKVGSALILDACKNLEKLPENGDIGFHLFANICKKIDYVPKNLKVGFILFIRKTKLAKELLGKNQEIDINNYKVGENIEIAPTPLKKK